MGDTTEDNERVPLSEIESVQLRRRGTSDSFTVPQHWLKTLPGLKKKPGVVMMFEAHVESDPAGNLFIIFRKVKNNEIAKLE